MKNRIIRFTSIVRINEIELVTNANNSLSNIMIVYQKLLFENIL